MTDSTTVDSSEKVARILSTEWFVDGQLMNIAFTLLEGETYISVNRPVIDTYDSDVAGFKSHAGIFTRYENKNVKRGDTLSLLEKEISADDVLIKVRTQLLNMTTVEQMTLCKPDESIVQE